MRNSDLYIRQYITACRTKSRPVSRFVACAGAAFDVLVGQQTSMGFPWSVQQMEEIGVKHKVSLSLHGLAVAALVLATAAWAGDIVHFRGETADAFFTSVDGAGCVATDVFLAATDGRSQAPPGPGNLQSTANIFISQFNLCTGTPLLSASGFAVLADQDFQVIGRLESATLNATIPVVDFVSGSTFDVAVAVNWLGGGDTTQQVEHIHVRSPGFIVNGHLNGLFRPAVAFGGVIALGTNFTPAPAVSADIANVRTGQVMID